LDVNPKEVALAHFEKAILGVCVAVMAWYLYSVLSIKPYARKPEEFTDATTKAGQYVRDPNRKLPEAEAAQLTSINFAEEAKRLFKEYVPDDVKEFIHLQRWVRPFDYGVTFRNEPKILAASQPKTQPNRGLMQTYLIDAAGNIKKQKVPKSKKKFGRGMREMAGMSGRGGGAGRDRSGGGDPRMGMGGEGTEGGDMSGASGGVGADGGTEGMMSGMMGGRDRSGGGDPRMGSGMEGADDGEPGPGAGKLDKKKIRHEFLERMKKKDAKDEKKDKKEEEVEEPIESREGYRFVEIVATFPHSAQIEEYVKALREPASQVKLQYASLDVERSELLPNYTWSEFKSIPIKEQFDLVMSAIGTQVETSRALIPGLAMNVPLLDVAQREFLHDRADLFPMYEKVEPAMYTFDILNPAAAEKRRADEEQRERLRNPQYKRSEKKKDAEEEKKFLPGREGGANLGFRDPNKQKEGKLSNHYRVKTAIVRYWDFTVEPGRKYKYRLRVKVYNPNYKRADVAESEAATRVILRGPWSPVSEEVFVDFDNHWYVADQKRSMRPNEMAIEVHHWYRGMGEWLVSTFSQRVGQFVGLTDKAKPIKALKWNDVIHEYEAKELKMDVQFDTSNLIVGIYAGHEEYELDGKKRTVPVPKEAVALNPFGDLVRHEESVDARDEVRQRVNENYKEMADLVASMTGEKKDDTKDPTGPPKKGAGGGRR
jgi:hypothetical protein